MAVPLPGEHPSPWRQIFEEVRRSVGNTRDDNGVLGSINWLRQQMEVRGANPNVVRNIIYRDKGKLADKRVLFDILNQLWTARGNPPLHAPELEVLLSPSGSAEQEVFQLLGREKRRAFRAFISGVRSGPTPKLLVSGRPGSGKTLLTDYIQQELEMTPEVAGTLVRLEFNSNDLATSLTRLASELDVSRDIVESKLVRVGTSGAYAVQADAQADVARVILESVRQTRLPLVLLLHVSQSIGSQDSLGMAPLRLNTPEVPRVSASEWLWLSLFEPLAQLPNVSILVSMTDVPALALRQLGSFKGPVKLSPPTASEARRFVKARLPLLSPSQQDDIVQRAGRSFEELRTLTLLAEIRESSGHGISPDVADSSADTARSIGQLAQLADTSGDPRLRDFLSALAVLSQPEFPTFRADDLSKLRDQRYDTLSNLELAFLDAAPGSEQTYRCFSRQLARALRQQLQAAATDHYRALNHLAAKGYHLEARQLPTSEAAARYLHHLFEARDWQAIDGWLKHYSIQQSLVQRIWQAAQNELRERDPASFEHIAQLVAAQYVRLGSYDHQDATAALTSLAASDSPGLRDWTRLKRAEGEVLRGRFDRAEALIAGWLGSDDPLNRTELALVQASIARWRSDLERAARLVSEVRPLLEVVRQEDEDASSHLVRAKVAVWAGLIAKDQGDLEGALRDFGSVSPADDLIEARIAFQRGIVQMMLGCFDDALAALDQAVDLSRRSEALVQEQSRYLARRATLRRRRGEETAANEDFTAAKQTLTVAMPRGLERDFWLAKIDDEAALNLLAMGDYDRATFVFRNNIETFQRYGQAYAVDASYRIHRSTLYLAIAYASRGLGRPYRTPHGPRPGTTWELPDLRHAQSLFDDIIGSLGSDPDRRHHTALRRQALLAGSLFASHASAAEAWAETALAESRFPYQRAESYAYLAAIQLRQERFSEVLDSVERAGHELQEFRGTQERGDLGLSAWLQVLAIEALVRTGRLDDTAERLAFALEAPELQPFQDAVLRAFGEQMSSSPLDWQAHPRLRTLLELSTPAFGDELVRLPDALVARWHTLR